MDLNSVLQALKESVSRDLPKIQALSEAVHTSGRAGDHKARNYSDAEDKLESYFTDILDSMMLQCDIEENQALDCLKKAMKECEQKGLMGPLPKDGDALGVMQWLGRAQSMGFAGFAMKCCIDMHSMS